MRLRYLRATDSMTVRLSVILALLGCLVAISYLGTSNHTELIRANAAAMSASGRQQVLAQQIACLVDHVSEAEGDHRIDMQDDLLTSVHMLSESHEALMNRDATIGAVTPLSAELETLYYGDPVMLDAKLRNYLANVVSVATARGRTFDQLSSPILPELRDSSADIAVALDIAAAEYLRQGDDINRRDWFLQASVLGATLVVVTLMAILVFRPILRLFNIEVENLRTSNVKQEMLTHENSVLAKISRVIGSSLEIDDVYTRFAEEVQKLIPFDRIVIGTINVEQNTFTLSYVLGLTMDNRDQGTTVPLDETQAEGVQHRRSVLLVQSDDPQELASKFPALVPLYDAGLRSFLSVPLISRDQIIGTLHLRSFDIAAYAERHVALAQRVGDQIAGAIANSEQYTERSGPRWRCERRTTCWKPALTIVRPHSGAAKRAPAGRLERTW